MTAAANHGRRRQSPYLREQVIQKGKSKAGAGRRADPQSEARKDANRSPGVRTAVCRGEQLQTPPAFGRVTSQHGSRSARGFCECQMTQAAPPAARRSISQYSPVGEPPPSPRAGVPRQRAPGDASVSCSCSQVCASSLDAPGVPSHPPRKVETPLLPLAPPPSASARPSSWLSSRPVLPRACLAWRPRTGPQTEQAPLRSPLCGWARRRPPSFS